MNERKLIYKQPAKSWEEALPLGNGRLGMMVYGGTAREILQLNEETLWCGRHQDADNPECLEHLDEMRELLFARKYSEAEELCSKYLVCRGKGSDCEEYGSFQTAGEVIIYSLTAAECSNYRRELDIFSGLASVDYDGMRREYLVSDKYNVTAAKISADCAIRISFSREQCEVTCSDGRIIVTGQNNEGNLHFCTIVAVIADDCQTTAEGIVVNDGRCVIYTATATDYCKTDVDPIERCHDLVSAATLAGYEEIKAQNVRYMTDAMTQSGSISLCTEPSLLPTDVRLKRVQEGDIDNGLVELYFNYGKYLLIASSKGVLPANLQGIWADGMWAAWNGDYHININLQMNYWHADVLGLNDYLEPLFSYIEMLSKYGADTARIMYGCRGWVAHTITNPWGFTAPGQDPAWGSFMCAGAWCCRHYFEHYLFTGDLDFLRRYYPVMRDSALFFTDFLVCDPNTGYLVTAPSNSPENHFIDPETGKATAMCAGPSMDNTIVYELFDFTSQAADLLGLDKELADELRSLMKRLPPLKIGKYGQVQEWQEDFDESEPGHRHISHLYGLYPAAVITESSQPELYEASKITLERRLSNGGGHTGWSRAWIINFYARLHDAKNAGFNMHELLAKSTLPNLFDFHPPFQIDGNFGGTAGICEMLIQSHQGFIELLPALPEKWSEGSFSGLHARGGFSVDARWSNGAVTSCAITSRSGGELVIKLNGRTERHNISAGETLRLC